jgi:hypothetical protein
VSKHIKDMTHAQRQEVIDTNFGQPGLEDRRELAEAGLERLSQKGTRPFAAGQYGANGEFVVWRHRMVPDRLGYIELDEYLSNDFQDGMVREKTDAMGAHLFRGKKQAETACRWMHEAGQKEWTVIPRREMRIPGNALEGNGPMEWEVLRPSGRSVERELSLRPDLGR